MNMLLIILSIVIMLFGLLGTILPLIPGIPLIWAVFLGYGLYDGWESYGLAVMVITGLAVAASLVLDQLASVWGAKRFGAGKAGMIGSIAGGILGVIFFSIPGLVLGAFAGAAGFEMLFGGQELKEAAEAGAGAVVGLLLGGLAKFIIGVVMILSFASMVVFN
jgi:uncharacterized protein YqgC (DUF456 family)